MNTKPQRQTRLTLSEVQQAIQQLQEQGIDKPSIRQIYVALGHRGSFSKIMKLKQQVLANTLPQISNNAAPLLANNRLPIDNISVDNLLSRILAHTTNQLQQMLANAEPQWWSKHDSTNQQLEWLQKQVQVLTEDLQAMYQLWRDSTQPKFEKVKETITPPALDKEPLMESSQLPNPQQTQAFISWAQQQKEQHHGSWKPVVEWLNQHHIVMLKGQLWTPKSLSDFIRKRKQQLITDPTAENLPGEVDTDTPVGKKS